MKRKELIEIIEKAARDKVTELDLSGKGIPELPPEIGNLTNLTHLDLHVNRLPNLPLEIGHLTNLTDLNLSGNQLPSLPPEIGNLTNLTNLNLSGNQLPSLPPEIGNLTNITGLFLYNDQLTSVPEEIGNLTNLTTLDLSHNQLTSLPAEIGNLSNIIGLFLYNNQLTSVPEEIGNLTNLNWLSLDRNQLTSVPEEIGNLTGLTELYLQRNQLTSLPSEIGNLTSLSLLDISNNPLADPPPDIIEQGTKAVLTYLRGKLVSEKQQWLSKLLLVGEGGVGKTSLLRALRGKSFDIQESKTEGIDILPLELLHPEQDIITMTLNCWDFGGQVIYHATHQFFLTNRSLFLLVWNARLGWEQGKLYKWLDTIKAKAPDSPVMIVAAHIDQHDAELPLQDLKAKYPQIVGHWEVSNKDSIGIEEIKRAVTKQAAQLPLMGENWPSKWLNAADAVRSRNEKQITTKQFFEILGEHELSNQDAGILARWLHELGDILYFPEDGELKDLVILKPKWVTDYISKVLKSDEVKVGLGVLRRKHMEVLWDDLDQPMQNHFLRLMEKFDLSYRTLDNRDISIVVERLPEDPKTNYQQSWEGIRQSGSCREISMKYHLDTTMPAGIPTWFIARTHRFTTYNHWRSGALFADGKEGRHLGLIQSFPHQRYLQLSARGQVPHNFFALLCDGLDLTLDRFPGLEIKRTIPCPGHKDKKCSYEFSLEAINNAIKENVKGIQCQVAFKNVPVSNLLLGIRLKTKGADPLTLATVLSEVKRIGATGQKTLEALQNLTEYAQREFTNLFLREQRLIESHCPNVFVLRPVESKIWLKNITGQKMELQLFCQAPGQWHPTVEGGKYPVKQTPEWFTEVAPFVSKLASVLKYTIPLVGPWLGALAPDFEKVFHNDIELMQALVDKLPEISTSQESRFAEGDFPERIAGSALRALRTLLDEKDPQQHWGGLKKILTPEGHYLWLCDYHAKEYD
ncbi:GTPase [candidate division LCP-89 bacterium B3_LCP]|uniref:non-specific serine/threonine protein kinase n=1 Tax=candidate division LCP-89 bacterium B3_LCP TaxID=2012998 RepID=A0A532UW00_UNCL8|nr:MAG: GTPase [candidate division LCP-89 bacterium B3_LCP]